MRHVLTALLLALSASIVSAQTASTSDVGPRTSFPVFAGLEYKARAATSGLPTFVVNTTPETPGRVNVDVNVGSLVITSRHTNARIAWLPILAPLPGSVPTTTSVMPDAFALNHVEYPWRKGLRP
jgi:hypothetical protein